MLVLDTDVVSILQSDPTAAAHARLTDRIAAAGQPVWVTVVTLQEQLRGRLARCTAAGSPGEYVTATRLLRKTWDDYRSRSLLDFDARAAAEFARLKAAKIRVGTMDLRIAAVALANDATLVTRNLADFRQVPGLRAEDWAA